MNDQYARQLPWFQRTCLVVSDLTKAFEVYSDLLGFSIAYTGKVSPDAYTYEIFNIDNNIQTSFATLSSVQQQRTLALVEVPKLQIYKNDIKISAIVVQVDDISNILAKATALSLTTTKPRIHEPLTGIAGRVEASFNDFDGHPIVIYQLLGVNS
jgi:catechol 2,3-dioxygenase-like lactoylglutathione lyase family enzyme